MDKLKEARELLQRLRDQHPNDTEEELSRRFAAAVRGDSMMFRAIVKDTLGDLLREPQRKGRRIEPDQSRGYRASKARIFSRGPQIDPETGAILRTIESNRFVTGVTWIDGELWHGTWEANKSLRRVDPLSQGSIDAYCAITWVKSGTKSLITLSLAPATPSLCVLF
jgi:hypothetical protein